jgi:hypothetical protein
LAYLSEKKEIPESSITELMEYLNEEVDGTLNAQKVRGDSSPASAYVPTAAAFQVCTILCKSKKPS